MKIETRLRCSYIISDLITIGLGWAAFNAVRYFSLPEELQILDLFEWLTHDTAIVIGQFVIPLVMLMLYAVSGFYNNPTEHSRADEAVNTAFISLVGMLGIYFSVLINDSVPERLRNYEMMLILWAFIAVPCYCGRLVVMSWQRRLRRRGHGLYDAVIIGTARDVVKLLRRVGRRDGLKSFKICAYIVDGKDERLKDAPVFDLSQIDAVIDHYKPQAAILADGVPSINDNMRMIASLFKKNIDIYVPIDLYRNITTGVRVSSVVDEPLINISRARIPASTMNLKRIGDIVISFIALILVAPVFALVAIAIKRDSPGPVFYRQERVGYHKRLFKIIKFRTMIVDAEAEGPALSNAADPRVTRVGRFLRKYRIDELPQFWNVLRGEMSLVGPRPERDFFVRQIVERVPHYSLVHQVRPGITSWGMVRYGYAEDVDEMVERLRYDLIYLENVSLGVDLKILFHTVNTVVTGKGV